MLTANTTSCQENSACPGLTQASHVAEADQLHTPALCAPPINNNNKNIIIILIIEAEEVSNPSEKEGFGCKDRPGDPSVSSFLITEIPLEGFKITTVFDVKVCPGCFTAILNDGKVGDNASPTPPPRLPWFPHCRSAYCTSRVKVYFTHRGESGLAQVRSRGTGCNDVEVSTFLLGCHLRPGSSDGD